MKEGWYKIHFYDFDKGVKPPLDGDFDALFLDVDYYTDALAKQGFILSAFGGCDTEEELNIMWKSNKIREFMKEVLA
jgi:hypothetical protein